MSHFTVVVLVRQDNVPEPGHPEFENQLLTAVNEMLAPFDETLDVTPYQRVCSCAEDAVSRQADKLAAEETGLTWRGFQDAWSEKTADEKTLTTWQTFTSPLASVEARYRAELMPDAKPVTDCEECHGSGFYASTYNKLSKWDWHSVGGRWDGRFTEENIPTIIRNVAFARDLQTAAYAPFAILSPREPHQKQGHDNWNEKGEMGWFAIVSNENNNWPAIANELFDKYAACFAVLVDCHI